MDTNNIKKITSCLIVAIGLLSATPAFAFGKKKEIIIPENYPEKYDAKYVEMIRPLYKDVAEDHIFHVALDMLRETNGEFSRRAILGNNLSKKPIKIMFKHLGNINPGYAEFDALGWKKSGRLYIFINPKHRDAPPGAIAALLSHEALHQDEYNSIAEETYAWTMEASVWCEILEIYPESDENLSPLVTRENTLKKLFEKGNYSNRYIKKSVRSNAGYKNLPATSPGFEDI